MEHEKYPLVKDEQLVFGMVCVSNFITSMSSFFSPSLSDTLRIPL